MQAVAAVAVGPEPALVYCQNCRAQVETKVTKNPKSSAYICCFVLFCFCCWPCCWIPFCMKSFLSFTHRCPNCKAVIGHYST